MPIFLLINKKEIFYIIMLLSSLDYLEKPVLLILNNWIKLTIKSRSLILVVSKCMLIVIRPDFEVVSLGRILHLVSGYRTVSYTHLRAHETGRNLVCRLLLE